MEALTAYNWEDLADAKAVLIEKDKVGAFFEENTKPAVRLLHVRCQTIEQPTLPLPIELCQRILNHKVDLQSQWHDDNGSATVVYETRRVMMREEGPPMAMPHMANSSFNFPPRPQIFQYGADVRDVAGFMFQTPRDDWPFFSLSSCYDGSGEKAGGIRAIIMLSSDADDIFQLSREHETCSLIKWEDECLHVIIPSLAFLSSHVPRVSTAFRSLSAQMSQIERALGDISSGSLGWEHFTKMLDQLNKCNTMYRPACDRWYFQGRLIKALEEFLDHRNSKTSRIRVDDTAATALAEYLAGLKRRSASHEHDVHSIPKRVKQLNSTIFNLTMQRDLQLNYELNKTNLRIAESSRQVALATREDSASMTTITIITMLFLPGTYVATFFSMGMFNWFGRGAAPETSLASTYIWLYFVVTVPLTILVVFTWWRLRRRRHNMAAVYDTRDLELANLT